MKVYIFYLVDDKITSDEYPAVQIDLIHRRENKEYCIYGYTHDKKIAERFKEMHNDKIIMKSHKITKEEFKKMGLDGPLEIREERLEYKTWDSKGKEIKNYIWIPLTQNEFWKLDELDIIVSIFENPDYLLFFHLISEGGFNEELLKSLNKNYLVSIITMIYGEYYNPSRGLCPEDYSDYEIGWQIHEFIDGIDELQIYINIYSNILVS